VILPRKVYKSSALSSQSFQLSDEIVISFNELEEGYDMKINSISFRNLQIIEKSNKAGVKQVSNSETVVAEKQKPEIVVEEKVEDKESIPMNNQQPTTEIVENEMGEIVQTKPEFDLLQVNEKRTSVFPLKEEDDEVSLNLPLPLRKMQSAEIPQKNNLDDLFDQITFNTDKTKEPCKAELVKNLYTRTFSSDACNSEDLMKQNENKIREDNFFRGFLMNPNGNVNINNNTSNNANQKWNFNQAPNFKNNIQNTNTNIQNKHSSTTLKTNFTDNSRKASNEKNNVEFNYPNLNDVDYGKFNAQPPKRRCESDNDLLQFTPVERYQAAEAKKSAYFYQGQSVKKNENFDDIVSQLFN